MASLLQNCTDIEMHQELLSGQDYLLSEGVCCIFTIFASTLGILGNAVNIHVFLSIGLKDGLMFCLLLLSCFDLAYLVTVAWRYVSFVMFAVEKVSKYGFWFPVEPYGMYVFAGHVSRIPYTASILTTTLLAVLRCASVSMPIRFKYSFNANFFKACVLTSAIFAFASCLPVLVLMGMVMEYDSNVNSSRPVLWISPHREEVANIVWSLRDAFIPLATQAVVVVCVVVMSRYLRASATFRHINAGHPNIKTTTTANSQPGDQHTSTKLGGKELQVLKQVVLICVVYIACNTPTIFFNFTGLFVSGFTVQTSFNNVFLLTMGVKHVYQSFHASVNFFIYYHYNSKFRHVFLKKYPIKI
ncbi:uncharacterized protein LOC131955104 [Physella acuta]|uniref:uncharacterized protein LOC131955104 n=1 Tax=Physella acuta TaxID=109671 RepID=UPI0027DE2234|nr:uncharacterized protein LOC131955104 [Physella acuta]